MAFDGANIWVTNFVSNGSVTRLRASDGACVVNGVVQSNSSPCSFPVGMNPVGVAFDGTYIWVANDGSHNVSKLTLAGANAGGPFSTGTGTFPQGVAFDGTYIWVANSTINGSAIRLRASDGACVTPCSFPVGGTFPTGIAFDGANIWVANFGGHNVTKLLASNGSNLGTFAAGSGSAAVAFDGANIWVANANVNTVSKF